MTALAERGASLIGVGRSVARCRDAAQTLKTEHPYAQVEYVTADLASQRQVRTLADTIHQVIDRMGSNKIDALVNNAGTVSTWYTATEDGYELQFAVNHLAPFLLTYLLMPLLTTSPAGRVITVSSSSHYRTRIRWNDIMHRRNYQCLLAYKQSKLANVLFSAEFNRRMAGALHAYTADPGLVNTQIGLKGTSGIERWVWQRRMSSGVTPAQGAETIAYLAADPAVVDSKEVYWKDCKPQKPSRYALQTDHANRLWQLSERLCGISWG
jgi:NAD(P)-dependent dehydrogenase (short-subunit alcohol dehydrogenase family)